MEEIINHVYSDNNLTKLCKKFSEHVDDFGNTDEAIQYCKLWLKKKMKSTIENNRETFTRGGNKRDIIQKLNKNCFITALNEYKNSK